MKFNFNITTMSMFNFSFLMLVCFCFNATCNGAVTFEQYEARQGDDFCAVTNKPRFTNMCKRIGTLNSFYNYYEEFMICECTNRELALVKQDGSAAPRRYENLLDCRYDERGAHASSSGGFTAGYHHQRALGRGLGSKDIIEYKYVNSKAVPILNRSGFLNEV